LDEGEKMKRTILLLTIILSVSALFAQSVNKKQYQTLIYEIGYVHTIKSPNNKWVLFCDAGHLFYFLDGKDKIQLVFKDGKKPTVALSSDVLKRLRSLNHKDGILCFVDKKGSNYEIMDFVTIISLKIPADNKDNPFPENRTPDGFKRYTTSAKDVERVMSYLKE
jgi:hypothetical protein